MPALVVPGPLQTAEYARAILQGIAPTISEAELDNLVASRMARQALLARGSVPQFFAVIDEGAPRRPIGEPGVMQRQLAHLLSAAEQPHVTLRLVPLAAGAHVGLRGSFVILEFTEEPALVFVETRARACSWRKRPIWRPTGWPWGISCTQYRSPAGALLAAARGPVASPTWLLPRHSPEACRYR